MIIQIKPIPAFNDNYIWALVHPQKATLIVVDPGDAKVVLDFMQQEALTLSAILITHHHSDHQGGVAELLAAHQVPVYAPHNPTISLASHRVKEGDCVSLDGLDLKVMEVPGHTLDHIAYYSDKIVFCGDTLFMGGCGRIFEGSAPMLYQSLQRLANLPEATLAYCAHEYTLSNLEFALKVDKDNRALQARYQATKAMRARGEPSVPGSIKQELATNPFLRCDTQVIKDSMSAYVGVTLYDPVAVFAELRRYKSNS